MQQWVVQIDRWGIWGDANTYQSTTWLGLIVAQDRPQDSSLSYVGVGIETTYHSFDTEEAARQFFEASHQQDQLPNDSE
jgi:hypothetical protein